MGTKILKKGKPVKKTALHTFKIWDVVRHKKSARMDTVKGVYGTKEYDDMGFSGPEEWFLLVTSWWEYHRDWTFVKHSDTKADIFPTEREPKVWDTVLYTSWRWWYGERDPKGTKWKIIELESDNWIRVRWTKDITNSYKRNDLTLADETKGVTLHKRYTYTKTYTRNDGIVFTEKTILESGYDTLTLEEIKALADTLTDKAAKLRWFLNSHKNLKF